MTLKNLISKNVVADPVKYKKILGIDSSTQKIAWTLVQAGKPKLSGKFDLSKQSDMHKKLGTIISELTVVLNKLKPDHICIEKSIYVRSHQTAIMLSYIVAGCVTTAISAGYEISEVEPMTWKAALGYTTLNRKFTLDAKKKLGPQKSKQLCERLRKSQTLRVIQHNFPSWQETDIDINDSCGIACWAWNQLARPLKLEISKTIAIDYAELDKLGLTL